MDARDTETLHDLLRRRGGFGHREHLELAWLYLERHRLAEAEGAMEAALRWVAERHGAPERYHDTLTRAWVRLVAVHRDMHAAGSFDAFIEASGGLLDRRLLDGHYTADRLAGDAARHGWVAPDVRPLPALA